MAFRIPAALHGRRLVVVDLEGNGRTPPEIIEIAALATDTAAGDMTSEADVQTWLIRPASPITAIVTRKVHGISNAEVAACPAWPAVAGDVAAVLADRVLVAHHASVEHRVLSAHLPRWVPPAVLDTLQLAKRVWPGLSDGYSLSALTTHAGIDPGEFASLGRHRAAYDTWCTWQLFARLVGDSGLTWDHLLAAAARPIAAVPPAAPVNELEGLW
jgi:DNA polymerase III epsilon subunit-like protein